MGSMVFLPWSTKGVHVVFLENVNLCVRFQRQCTRNTRLSRHHGTILSPSPVPSRRYRTRSLALSHCISCSERSSCAGLQGFATETRYAEYWVISLRHFRPRDSLSFAQHITLWHFRVSTRARAASNDPVTPVSAWWAWLLRVCFLQWEMPTMGKHTTINGNIRGFPATHNSGPAVKSGQQANSGNNEGRVKISCFYSTPAPSTLTSFPVRLIHL